GGVLAVRPPQRALRWAARVVPPLGCDAHVGRAVGAALPHGLPRAPRRTRRPRILRAPAALRRDARLVALHGGPPPRAGRLQRDPPPVRDGPALLRGRAAAPAGGPRAAALRRPPRRREGRRAPPRRAPGADGGRADRADGARSREVRRRLRRVRPPALHL